MRIMNILCYFKIQKTMFHQISKFPGYKCEDKGKSNLAKSPKAEYFHRIFIIQC